METRDSISIGYKMSAEEQEAEISTSLKDMPPTGDEDVVFKFWYLPKKGARRLYKVERVTKDRLSDYTRGWGVDV